MFSDEQKEGANVVCRACVHDFIYGIKSGMLFSCFTFKIHEMKFYTFAVTLLSLCLGLTSPAHSQSGDLTSTILHLDSLFWQAYNTCDVDGMAKFFTEDVEFYHDKNGLITTKASMVAGIRKGLCGNENFRLRREAVPGSVRVFPLNNYGAILSGEHVFYINEKGKKEFPDGLARFTHVWQFKDNTWRMSRILSYDHGPAPYKDPGEVKQR